MRRSYRSASNISGGLRQSASRAWFVLPISRVAPCNSRRGDLPNLRFAFCNPVPTMDSVLNPKRDQIEPSGATEEGSEKHAEEPPVSAHRRSWTGQSGGCRGSRVCAAGELFGNAADGAVGYPNRRDADLPAIAWHARGCRWSTAGSVQISRHLLSGRGISAAPMPALRCRWTRAVVCASKISRWVASGSAAIP